MRPTELKMQPTIHLECKAGCGRGRYPALPSQCIVGYNSVGLIITREIPCITASFPYFDLLFRSVVRSLLSRFLEFIFRRKKYLHS
jgi:hypothetical protein